MKKQNNALQLIFVTVLAVTLTYIFVEYNQTVLECFPALKTIWSELKSIYYHENFKYLVMLLQALLSIRKKPSWKFSNQKKNSFHFY